VWDLDNEAAEIARKLELGYARAATPGTDPRFVAMIRELVVERRDPRAPVRELSRVGRNLACGTEGCCPAPRRPA
jgi:ferrochelatase